MSKKRACLICVFMVLFMFNSAVSWAEKVNDIDLSSGEIVKGISSYYGGRRITLTGKFIVEIYDNPHLEGDTTEHVKLVLDEPANFLSVYCQLYEGHRNFYGETEIQLFTDKFNYHGKHVSVTGTLGGAGPATIYSQYCNLWDVSIKEIPSAKSISLNKSSTTLKVGNSITLKATVKPSQATQKVIWSSSSSSIASVDSNGKVIAKKKGTVTITAKTSNGKKATCKVTVKAASVSVKNVKMTPTTVTLNIGKTKQLIATVSPSNAKNKTVTWTSSNKSVATVSSKGLVTARASGKTTITVKTKDGGYTAKCVVTVSKPAPAKLNIKDFYLYYNGALLKMPLSYKEIKGILRGGVSEMAYAYINDRDAGDCRTYGKHGQGSNSWNFVFASSKNKATFSFYTDYKNFKTYRKIGVGSPISSVIAAYGTPDLLIEYDLEYDSGVGWFYTYNIPYAGYIFELSFAIGDKTNRVIDFWYSNRDVWYD